MLAIESSLSGSDLELEYGLENGAKVQLEWNDSLVFKLFLTSSILQKQDLAPGYNHNFGGLVFRTF